MAEIFTSVISSRKLSIAIFEVLSILIEMSPERYLMLTCLSLI